MKKYNDVLEVSPLHQEKCITHNMKYVVEVLDSSFYLLLLEILFEELDKIYLVKLTKSYF